MARALATDLAGYLTGRMMAPDGGFYTAEDADIDGREGETYLWTEDEIASILGEDADRFFSLYQLTLLESGSDEGGVLRIREEQSDAEVLQAVARLESLRAKLLAIRDRRRQPARDDKIVVGLNGLATESLARAGAVFGEQSWIEAAKLAGEALWRQAFDEKIGKLARYLYAGAPHGDGFLDDYALLGLGYLALNEATGDQLWLERANKLADAMLTRFVNPGGVVMTAEADPTAIVPPIDLGDGDTPSGTSAAYSLLARLGRSEPRYAEAATKIMAWVAPKLEAAPASWASFIASATKFGAASEEGAETSSLDSAAHVKASARMENGGDHDEIVITLTIAPGYHVNANPASLDYLIPTRVEVAGFESAKVIYPPGEIFRPKFLPEGISVYEGSAAIKIEVPRGSGAWRKAPLSVEVQACTDRICLPPATIALHVGEC